MQKEYTIEIHVSFPVTVWADDEQDAIQRAQSEVFEQKVNHGAGDLIRGYKIIK